MHSTKNWRNPKRAWKRWDEMVKLSRRARVATHRSSALSMVCAGRANGGICAGLLDQDEAISLGGVVGEAESTHNDVVYSVFPT